MTTFLDWNAELIKMLFKFGLLRKRSRALSYFLAWLERMSKDLSSWAKNLKIEHLTSTFFPSSSAWKICKNLETKSNSFNWLKVISLTEANVARASVYSIMLSWGPLFQGKL